MLEPYEVKEGTMGKMNLYSRGSRQFGRGGPVRWEPENTSPRLGELRSLEADFLSPNPLSGRGMAFFQVLIR